MPQGYSIRRGRVALLIIFFVAIGMGIWLFTKVRNGAQPIQSLPPPAAKNPDAPIFDTTVILDGLSHVWDIGFLPDGTAIFTERSGTISKVQDNKKVVLASIENLYMRGEGGLLGLAIDPRFESNRYIYACYDTPQDIRLSRWKVNVDATGLTDQTDIITDMPVNTRTFPGRHSGCRPRFGADGYLWVGTGDAGQGTNPQDPGSLGGKVLRVDRDGKAVAGNLGAPFDLRIYSYGHRNVQGLAMLPSPRYGVYGYSAEHGPNEDDEVTPLKSGNMGWNPVPGYNESVPMTDKTKYPNAIDPLWRSGSSTIAPSGMTFLIGEKWKGYEGRLAMAVLKGEQLRILELDDAGALKGEEVLFKGQYGRIRSAVQDPDDILYLTTDNGNGKDQIIRVNPR